MPVHRLSYSRPYEAKDAPGAMRHQRENARRNRRSVPTPDAWIFPFACLRLRAVNSSNWLSRPKARASRPWVRERTREGGCAAGARTSVARVHRNGAQRRFADACGGALGIRAICAIRDEGNRASSRRRLHSGLRSNHSVPNWVGVRSVTSISAVAGRASGLSRVVRTFRNFTPRT